ncbi:uncharacterized vacuolar membrane protein [Tanacetum coccineum]
MDFILVHNHIIQLVSTYRGRAYVEIVYAGYLLGVNVSCSLGSDGIGIVSLGEKLAYIEDKMGWGGHLLFGEVEMIVFSKNTDTEAITLLVEKDEVAQTIGFDIESNTILSSASSLFTFLVSLAFLGEKFTWLKLLSVLLCMGGTIIVSLGDSKTGTSATASTPTLGDFLALVSSAFYAVYITLIRKNLPDEDDDAKTGKVSMAQFLGFLGLFNLLIFAPIAFILHLANLEPFDTISRKQFGLIVGKGFTDNVLAITLWAKAVLLTTTTVATAGLTIQVPLAAIVDTVIGNAPGFMDYIGATAVMVGFAGINIPSDTCSAPKEAALELEENHTTDHSRPQEG